MWSSVVVEVVAVIAHARGAGLLRAVGVAVVEAEKVVAKTRFARAIGNAQVVA